MFTIRKYGCKRRWNKRRRLRRKDETVEATRKKEREVEARELRGGSALRGERLRERGGGKGESCWVSGWVCEETTNYERYG